MSRCSEEIRMLNDIGILDFVLTELTLFLDTHPQEQAAMEQFNHYARIRDNMTRDFSKMYYPLTKDLAQSTTEWRWGGAPLPWEGDC